MNSVSKLDPLTRDVLRWQKTHDNATGERIAKAMFRAVDYLANRQPRHTRGAISNVETEDIRQFFWCIVFEAAEKFEAARGVKFSSFAIDLLGFAVKEFWREDGGRLIKNKRARPDCWCSVVSYDGFVAREPNSDTDVREFVEARPSDDVAVDETTLSAITCDELIAWANRHMPQREREVISHRFNGLALSEVGKAMGISESRAFQLEKHAQQRMRFMVSQPKQGGAHV